MWKGDYWFLLSNLIAKDFKIRYRNMSLGVLWSVLNPLVMMGVLTFVLTKIFVSPIPNFPVFLLCGLVPFNFFSIGWANGTTSLVENAALIKRVPVPRQIVPIGSVLSNCIHLCIQVGILITVALLYGFQVNVYWAMLPALWILEVVFVVGLALIFSALNVYVRDTRYVIESATIVLWWLVPIVYPFDIIPQDYKELYQYNPLAALVMAMRTIILEARAPSETLLIKLFVVSFLTLGLGWFIFKRLEHRFYNHL